MKPWFTFLLILVAACACAPLTPAPAAVPAAATPLPTLSPSLPPAPTAAPTVVPSPVPSPTPQPWTLEQFKNFTYTLEAPMGAVTLADGKFTKEIVEGKGSYTVRGQLIEKFATGDLNGDGLADAAVILAVNTGGSGTFHSLFIFLAKGGQAARQYLGDRIVERQISIADGKITLDILRQGPKDALCCPSEHAILTFRLNQGTLEKLSDQVAGPVYPNQITITAPDAAVKNPFQIQGKVSQMPFEKNLVYRVYDAAGQKILEGHITVQSELSGPGTFTQTIQLPASYHGQARVEIIDQDASSGQPRGLASVTVVLQ